MPFATLTTAKHKRIVDLIVCEIGTFRAIAFLYCINVVARSVAIFALFLSLSLSIPDPSRSLGLWGPNKFP